MKIKELGGEFAFIERIKKKPKNKDVMIGVGDDCAVVKIDEKRYHLYTTDMLVEGDHFSRSYFTPYEIGVKAMESNISDIAAMGGKTVYGFISLALPSDIDVAFLDEFYRGIYEKTDFYNFDLIGGDTTHGEKMVINITLVGETDKEKLKLRSTAKRGELIVVSRPIGGSTAGLRLLLKNIDGFENVKKYHKLPESEMKNLEKILPFANAMEDISDGLASEIRNICKKSGTGAIIYKSKIPLSDGIKESAKLLGEDPYDYALFGGEDFKLVYTTAPENRDRVFGTIVGEITEGNEIYLDNKKLEKFGYDHFA